MASTVITPSVGDVFERAAGIALRGHLLRGRAFGLRPAGYVAGKRALGATSTFAGTSLPAHSCGVTDPTG